MSFPIIDNLGGQEEALAILAAAGRLLKPTAVRMWQERRMPSYAQLIFTNKAIELGIKYEPSDFIYQPEEPNNG